MGFKPPAKKYELDFSGTDLDGLVVTLKGLTVGQFLRMQEVHGRAEKDAEAAAEVFRMFAAALTRWNLEDQDDQPVPPTLDGIKTQELAFIMEIIPAWMNAMASVPESVGKDSTPGPQYPVVNLPMEALSANRAS